MSQKTVKQHNEAEYLDNLKFFIRPPLDTPVNELPFYRLVIAIDALRQAYTEGLINKSIFMALFMLFEDIGAYRFGDGLQSQYITEKRVNAAIEMLDSVQVKSGE